MILWEMVNISAIIGYYDGQKETAYTVDLYIRDLCIKDDFRPSQQLNYSTVVTLKRYTCSAQRAAELA